MLYVTFQQPENFNRNVDVYFNNRYEDEWLEDPVVKQIVRRSNKVLRIDPEFYKSNKGPY